MIPIHSYTCKLCNYEYPKKIKSSDKQTIQNALNEKNFKLTKYFINQMKGYLDEKLWADEQYLTIGKRDLDFLSEDQPQLTPKPSKKTMIEDDSKAAAIGKLVADDFEVKMKDVMPNAFTERKVAGQVYYRKSLISDLRDVQPVEVHLPESTCFVTKIHPGLESAKLIQVGKDTIVAVYGLSLIEKLDDLSAEDMELFSAETQSFFRMKNLTKIGRAYSGKSYLKFVASSLQLKKEKKTRDKDHAESKSAPTLTTTAIRYLEIEGDALHIRVKQPALASPAPLAHQTVTIGIVSSRGDIQLSVLPVSCLQESQGPAPLHPSPKLSKTTSHQSATHADVSKKLLITPLKGVVCFEAELVSTFEFLGDSKLIAGCQSGAVYIAKYSFVASRFSSKVLRSFNFNQNFMVTNVCLYPPVTGCESSIFAVSTADGFIKFFDEFKDHPLFEYQSINVSFSQTENHQNHLLGPQHPCARLLERKREVPAELPAHPARERPDFLHLRQEDSPDRLFHRGTCDSPSGSASLQAPTPRYSWTALRSCLR